MGRFPIGVGNDGSLLRHSLFCFMTYTVYVLYSSKFEKIYIGYSSNLKQRVLSHNQLATKGWTIKFRPWEVVYTEDYVDKPSAMKRS